MNRCGCACAQAFGSKAWSFGPAFSIWKWCLEFVIWANSFAWVIAGFVISRRQVVKECALSW
jgi:hypothetical protein